jgi:hypothetical protein
VTLKQASEWLEKAIAAGRNPRLYRCPKWMPQQWLYHCDEGSESVGGGRLRLEIEIVLEEMGRTSDEWIDFMPWQFQSAPGDASAGAIAARLMQARTALGLDLAAFYAPTGLTLRTVKKWEAGKRSFPAIGDKPLVALCKAHGISEFWIVTGGKWPSKWLSKPNQEAA